MKSGRQTEEKMSHRQEKHRRDFHWLSNTCDHRFNFPQKYEVVLAQQKKVVAAWLTVSVLVSKHCTLATAPWSCLLSRAARSWAGARTPPGCWEEKGTLVPRATGLGNKGHSSRGLASGAGGEGAALVRAGSKLSRPSWHR